MTETSIRWQQWGEEAFTASEDGRKPVLLALTATWCHWCHVMDQTTYSDPRVMDVVNSRFIPVRVDVDQRPDVSRRYNQGGYPSLAILDHQGSLIAGRIYTPPDVLLPILERVSEDYPLTGAPSPDFDLSAISWPESSPSAGGEPYVARVLESLGELYDSGYGGLGDEPKQPPWEALGLLMARYGHTGDRGLLRMVTKTLDGIIAGLYDRRDGGFFRYSVSRDWAVPHYEKMSLTNAGLAAACLEAFQVTRRTAYRDAATGAIGYLMGALYDPSEGLFHASQDAGEEYYRLPWKDRTPDLAPAIDRTFYTDWNAAVASALLKAYDVLGNGRCLESAVRVLDRLWAECRGGGPGLRHVVGAADQPQRYLVDQVQAARACLDLHQSTGQPVYLDRAVNLVRDTRELFGSEDGGYCDVFQGPDAPGPAPRRELPLLENSWLAETLVRLWQLTGDGEYLDEARRTLEMFRGVAPGGSYLGPPGSRRMEEDEEALFLPAGSAWGRAWDMVESGPVHMVLVGEDSQRATRQLLRAALRAHAPYKVVQQLDPGRDGDRIAGLGFPTGGSPALYVCMNGVCLAPLTSPGEVRRLGTTRPWAGSVSFVNFQEL